MHYAVVSIAGKQQKVRLGETLTVDRLPTKPGDTVIFDNVLLVVESDAGAQVGTPSTGTIVTAKVLTHEKGPKIRVATYKAKSHYRKVKGHRQAISRIEIVSIGDRKKETDSSTKPRQKVTKAVSAKSATQTKK